MLENGDSYAIPSGTDYDLTITPAGGSANSADQAFARLMDAGADASTITLRFSLHDGAVGTNFTSNEIAAGTNGGYARQAVAFEVVVV